MNPDTPVAGRDPAVTRGIVARFIQIAVFFFLQAIILFTSAGRLSWTWAWVFLGICTVGLAVNGTIMLRKCPETIAERGRPGETRGWDKIVGGLWGLLLFVIVPLLAGLDVRLGWTGTLSLGWHLVGAGLLVAGSGLVGWAMISNVYFSTAVRIQHERGHTVCRAGPYGLVRHPGYSGFILQSLSTPLLLGSLVALAVGVAAAMSMVLRTVLEDRTLQTELSGYREYTHEVRHRLVPGVW